MTARDAALRVLNRLDRTGSYSNLNFDIESDRGGMDERDAALASRLVNGVTERRISIDYYLSGVSNRSADKIDLPVLNILRIGAYQILYMDRIPQWAAVDEAVKQAYGLAQYPFRARKSLAGFVNAALRELIRDLDNFALRLPKKGGAEYLSARFSVRPWIARLLLGAYGGAAEPILGASFGGGELCLRVNTLKTTAEELSSMLAAAGLKPLAHAWAADALILQRGGSVEDLPGFRDGLFHVQDAASQLCCAALELRPGMKMLDMCAAPGGKSITAAQYMQNSGELIAADANKKRLSVMEAAFQRMGVACGSVEAADGTVYMEKYGGRMDRVLCDAPCSGLGVMGKKPDIRLKSEDEAARLPELQRRLLANAARYVTPGGRLVYSTCTLNPEENEKIAEWFLSLRRDFTPASGWAADRFKSRISGGTLTLFPHTDACDGFFIAAFDRLL